MKNRNTGKALLSQLAVILFAALLLMCAVTSALAEQTGATDDPYHFGLNEEEDPNAGKVTGTPKPTKTPNPTPTEFPFEPGLREDHEGHLIEYQIIDSNDWRHTIKEYCRTCRMTIKAKYTEDHQLDENGHCTKCSYQCKHDRTFVHEVPADGGEKTWDGNWISYPGTEITVCYRCNKYLKYENTVIRKFHNRHTRFLPEQECLPHDADTHALVRICEDCGTEVTEYVQHNCPSSDRPYTDEGDPDTHSRLVRCADCGFWVPQQQAHTWVHDSYKKDDTDGSEEGHIETVKCDVCGAVKDVKSPHDAGTLVTYRKDGDAGYHTEVRQCTLCGEQFEIRTKHELEHISYKNDGDTQTHIDVQVCILCGQEVEGERVGHSRVYITSKIISETHHAKIMRCNICGFTDFNTFTQIHHFETAYQPNNKESHYVYENCHDCEAKKNFRTEAHKWGNGACKKCGEAKEGHQHEANTFYKPRFKLLNEEQHIPFYHCILSKCEAKVYVDPEPHTFDPLTLQCTKCGYQKEGCTHQYTYKPLRFKTTADEHTLMGTCTNCGKEIIVTSAHNMQFVSKSDYRPCENGHTFTVTDRCTDCGYETTRTETEGHTIRAEAQVIDDNTHLESCEFCSYTVASSHSFENNASGGNHRCEVCGFEKDHSYDISYDGITDKSHYITYYCKACKYETSSREGHRFDEQWVCVCGYHR